MADLKPVGSFACGYVADKIGRLASGKKKDGEDIKGVTERECVLSGNKTDKRKPMDSSAVVTSEKSPVAPRGSPPTIISRGRGIGEL